VTDGGLRHDAAAGPVTGSGLRHDAAAGTGTGAVGRLVLRGRPYLLVFVLSAFVVSRWFRTGTFIATGDMGPFIRRGWAPELTWSWNHQVTGAGSASSAVARGSS
jgi:arabinofuranan 3-O-arabinosyltransferase